MRTSSVCALVVFIALGVVLGAARASAQWHRATDPVATPASSIVLLDDALALDHNPAAIGMLPAYSLAYLHSEVDRRDDWLARGDALYFATPVLGPLALGATLQSIRPGDAAARPPAADDADRAMAAFALALAPGPQFSLGVTTRAFYSGNPRYDGLTAVDAGMLLRPDSRLSASLVARDLFVSREGFGTTGLALGTSFVFSLGLRPFASDALTFDLGLAFPADDVEQLGGRGGVSVRLPYVGTASGLLEVDGLGDADPALRLVAELAVNMGHVSAIGGVTGGDGFDDAGWYAMLRSEGRPRAGVPTGTRVLELELTDGSPRSMIGVGLALERARLDPRVGGVLLRPRGVGLGFAYAQELRLQIRALQAAGKPVVCHLESASGTVYYACAGADRVLIDPAGDVRLMGTAASVLLFGETLRKIGVRAEFIRIGDDKSAPEAYTQDHMSDAARARMHQLLNDAHRRMLSDLATDLEVTPGAVADLMDNGPYVARTAIEQGLVRSAVDEYEIDDELDLFHGAPRNKSLPERSELDWGRRPSVAVVMVDDAIVDGESTDVPLLDLHTTGGATIAMELDALARDPSVRAIVLRVDSPGGAVMASDQIWRAVRRARERKPVIASMGQVAASGGYYVASAADEIWADPSTLTGSIGIFYGKIDVVGLAQKLGVHVENFSRGRHAGADSLFRPFTDEERVALADMMRAYYRTFLLRVAEGRHMTVEQVDALGRGQVYSGDRAQVLGLVDRLGGFASALVRARQLAGLPSDADVIVRPPRRNRLIDFVLGGAAASIDPPDTDGSLDADGDALSDLSPELRALLRMSVALRMLGEGSALALMPYELSY